MVRYLSYVPEVILSELLLKKIREKAAYCTEEDWKYYLFYSVEDIKAWAEQQNLVHLISWDLSGIGAVDMLESFRKEQKDPMLLVIADEKMSPQVYLKPSVMPSSLLLKPVSREEIDRVIDEFVDSFLQKFYGDEADERFTVENREGRIQIPYAQIVYFEAREKKVFVRTGREEYGFYDTLDSLESRLKEEFLRCHRSFLVNKNKIAGVYLSQNRIALKDGFEVPLSRSYKPAVKEYLKKGGNDDGRSN